MKKLYSLLFIVVAIAAWNFVSFEIQTNPTEPITISINHSVAYAADPQFLTKMLNGTNISASTGRLSNEWFFRLYSFSRGLLNICLFLFLVYVAFRNILNLNIETYAIKKIIPKLIFAAFLGNLLLPIATIMSSLLDALQSAVPIFHPPGSWDWIGMVSGGLAVAGGSTLLGFLTMFLNFAVGSLLVVAPIIINIILVGGLLLLGLFHSLRPWIVLLAVAFGPIAVGLSALPETEGVFKKWWKILIFWIYYPILLSVIYYLAKMIPSMAGAVGDGFLSSLIGNLIPMVLKIALFGVAVRAPFTWEKDIGGIVAAIPGQAQKGFKQATAVADYARKVPRVAYEVRKNYVEKGTSTTMARARQEGRVTELGQRMMARDPGSAARLERQRSIAVREEIAGLSGEQRQQIFGTRNARDITDEMIAERQARFEGGDYVAGMADADPDVAAAATTAQNFFNTSHADETAQARVQSYYEAQADQRMQRRVASQYNNSPLAKYLKWESQYGAAALISGAAGAIRNNSESDNKEEEKEMKRENMYYKRFSSRLARGRSETERIASDVANATRTEDLDEYKDTFQDILRNIYDKATNLNKSDEERQLEAMDYMRNLLDHLKNQGENPAGWDRTLWGLNQNWTSGSGRNFEDTMHRAQAVWQRLSVLINQEARSSVDREEQRRRSDVAHYNYMASAWGGDLAAPPPAAPGGAPGGPAPAPGAGPAPGGAPSGGASGPAGPGGEGPSGAPLMPTPTSGGGPAPEGEGSQEILGELAKVSRGLRDINDSIGNLNSQLKTTSGAPLERIRKLISTQNTKNITSQDLELLGEDTESGLGQIGSILTKKDPSESDEAREIVQKVDGAKGGSTPEILAEVKQEFYPDGNIDPNLERNILKVSGEPVVEMAFENNNDQNQAVLEIAKRLSTSKLTQDVKMQLDQSIDVFNKSETDPASVSPQVLEQAKNLIAAQVGLPDGSTIDRKMVDQISQAVVAATTNNPLGGPRNDNIR